MDDSPHESCARVILDHARLISNMRENQYKSVAFHYGSYCSWRDTFSSLESLKNKTQQLEQLECRVLSQLRKAYPATPNYRSIIRQPLEEVVRSVCLAFVNQLHEKMDKGLLVVTNVLGYDLFWAGISFLFNIGTGFFSSEQRIKIEGNGVEKCLTLLTVVGERFPDLKPLRRALYSGWSSCKGESSELLVSALRVN